MGETWRRLAALAAAGTVVVGVGAGARPVGAATPAPLTARQIADRDQPAIDLIETETTATLTIFLPTLDIGAVVNYAQNNNDVQNYLSQSDDEDAARAIIAEIGNNVDKYLEKGDATSYNADIGAQGSGFTVTPDGYIVTNAHVGSVDPGDAASQFLDTLPDQQLTDIQQAFIQQFGGLNDNGTPISIPSDQDDAVLQLLGQFVGETADVSGLTTKITVFQGASSASGNGMDATLVTAGKVFPDKDVAILKVDANGLPTVPLGDDTALHDGDPVYAIGYPGDATFDKDVVKTTKYTSTISSGIVSNRLQSSAADYQYIEHTATINHGNSGGALINATGQTVGITTASDSSTEAANGVNGGKFFYAVPTSVVRDFLNQAHVTPSAAPSQALYQQGIVDIEQNKLFKAHQKFVQAQSQGLNTPYLAEVLAQTAGAKDTSSSSGGTIAAIAGGGVVLVLIVILLVVLLSRRRKGGSVGGAIPATAVPVGYGPQGLPPGSQATAAWPAQAPQPGGPPAYGDPPPPSYGDPVPPPGPQFPPMAPPVIPDAPPMAPPPAPGAPPVTPAAPPPPPAPDVSPMNPPPAPAAPPMAPPPVPEAPPMAPPPAPDAPPMAPPPVPEAPPMAPPPVPPPPPPPSADPDAPSS